VPDLPARGPDLSGLGLPPTRLPLFRRGRLRKRWRYVAVYTPELMLCVGDARIGPVPQRWWAVALPGGELVQDSAIGRAGVRMDGSRVTVSSPRATIELELDESGGGVETASPIGDRGNWIWTRKQACVPVRGRVVVDGSEHPIEGDLGFVDESGGYHHRHTAWRWSAGLGRTADGRRVGWNLVAGVHDHDGASERTLWLDREPRELGPAEFAADLSSVSFDGARLDFTEWSAREERMNVLLLRSTYRQPFGTFRGSLPGGMDLVEGCGVMEEHDVYW
jgi:hypothetical protein